MTKPAKFSSIYFSSIALVSAMEGILFGYAWVVEGGTKAFYETSM